MFTDDQGARIAPWRLTQGFLALARELPLPPMHLHGLRHCAASHMLMSGSSPKVVQDTLGHAQISMTLDLYGHVMPSQRDASAEAAERLYQ